MSRQKILKNFNSLKSIPIAIEALWDGDSTGWFVCFSAISSDGQSHTLGVLSYGGDIRLFHGQVPPWPEAADAKRLGSELAERFGVEFYFPSPDHPEDDCPGWKDRKKGYPCRRCGILLLQPKDCQWYGICLNCHLGEEQEQRVGPKCHICGNPGTNELNREPVCTDCFNKYEIYTCGNCDGVSMILKSIGHTSLCSICELEKSIDSLSEMQRKTIRDAMAKGMLKAIQTTMGVMGCSLYHAQGVLNVLGDANKNKNNT